MLSRPLTLIASLALLALVASCSRETRTCRTDPRFQLASKAALLPNALMMNRITRSFALALTLLLVGCPAAELNTTVDTGSVDTATDTPTTDSGEDVSTEPDAREDAAADTSDDARADATEDVTPDSAEDTRTDADEDATPDADRDTPVEDVKLDAEPDAVEDAPEPDLVEDVAPDTDDDTGSTDECIAIRDGTDFGLCELLLGWGFNGSECVPYSGCDCEPFCHAFFPSPAECEAACAPAPDGCDPAAAEADYGPCRLVLGYAFNGSECVLISGCSCEPYCESIHETMEMCETSCG